MEMITLFGFTPGRAARIACLIDSVLLNVAESDTTTSMISDTVVGATGGEAATGAALGAATGAETGDATGGATGDATGGATGDATGGATGGVMGGDTGGLIGGDAAEATGGALIAWQVSAIHIFLASGMQEGINSVELQSIEQSAS